MHRIVDLSIDHDAHFRWGVERSVKQETLPDGGVFTITSISTTVHAFTHMDSPRHVVPDGPTTDDISLDRVIGETAIVDLVDIGESEAITERRLWRTARVTSAPATW